MGILAQPLHGSFSNELAVREGVNVPVAMLIVSSDDPNGFTIEIESRNAGRLVRTDSDGSRRADRLRYRVDLEPSVGGTLGSDLPSASRRRNLDLSSGRSVIRFGSGTREPTVNKVFELQIHTPAKPELFSGSYSDVLAVTINDL